MGTHTNMMSYMIIYITIEKIIYLVLRILRVRKI